MHGEAAPIGAVRSCVTNWRKKRRDCHEDAPGIAVVGLICAIGESGQWVFTEPMCIVSDGSAHVCTTGLDPSMRRTDIFFRAGSLCSGGACAVVDAPLGADAYSASRCDSGAAKHPMQRKLFANGRRPAKLKLDGPRKIPLSQSNFIVGDHRLAERGGGDPVVSEFLVEKRADHRWS
jgi:hypothetical protein